MFGLTADAYRRQPSGGFACRRIVRALLELSFKPQEERVRLKPPYGKAYSLASAGAAKQPESGAKHPNRMPRKCQTRPDPEPHSVRTRQPQVNQFLAQPTAFGVEQDELEASGRHGA